MKYIKFIRIFLLVLIIIGIGLLVTQKIWVPKVVEILMRNDNKVELIPVVANDNSKKNDNNKITDLKTYTNNEYGFEVKYPLNWKESWSHNSEYKKASLNLKDEINEFSINFNSFGDIGYVEPSDVDEVDITIGGVLLKRFTYTEGVTLGKYTVISTYCANGEKNCEDPLLEEKYSNIVFVLECEISKSSKEECNNLFDSIVSTFKFLK